MHSPSNGLRSGYIPTLDGWRAIAILLVLFDHTASRLVFPSLPPYGWTRLGGHGVQIFFVLSGYLITGKLVEDGSLKKFYTRRAFRILPVLCSYLAVVSLVSFGFHRIPANRNEILKSLLFLVNYRGGGPFTGHLWSLSVEEQFYLCWPLLMLTVVRGNPRQRLLRAAWFFGLGFSLVLLARLTVLPYLANVLRFYTGLAAGCALRLALADDDVGKRIRAAFWGRSGLAVFLLAIYLVWFHARITLFDPLFCTIAICATLVEPGRFVGRFLELPLLRWVGRLSYSLYIWQELFLGYGPTYQPFGFFSRFPMNLVSLVAVSCFSYYLMERPLMRLGQQITSDRDRGEITIKHLAHTSP